MRKYQWIMICLMAFVVSCARTDIIESPKTGYVAETDPVKEPEIIWTSRTVGDGYSYLGTLQVRAWTWDAAINRLRTAAREMRADAITDVHYEKIGFLTSMQAFAVKFEKSR